MLHRPFPRRGSRYTYAFGSAGMSFLSRMNLLAVDEGNGVCSVNAVSPLAPPPLTFGGVSTLCQHYRIRPEVPVWLDYGDGCLLTPTTRLNPRSTANTGNLGSKSTVNALSTLDKHLFLTHSVYIGGGTTPTIEETWPSLNPTRKHTGS